MEIVMLGETCLPCFTSMASSATVKWYWVAMRISSSAVKFFYATKSLLLGKAPFVFCRLLGEKRDDFFSEQPDRREHWALLAHDVAEEKVIAAQSTVLLNLGNRFFWPADDEGLQTFTCETSIPGLE